MSRRASHIARELLPWLAPLVLAAGALLLADELLDAKNRLAALQVEVGRLQADRARLETKAVSALEGAAIKIEKLAAAG